ncbi:uncharacterized protein AB675_11330 [Cyphellophora attinorum]|uniref:Phosphatase SPAC5H10.03 n=1 Tax=Cyphellophora attinorum TaxID=1664694 RepID=A0A0N0NMG4_9EURO|nr:uncharacterized protein AB675_11330 [Phialophora attinorum]KPI40169.1 hypothetical protein AB675_11330 [Phialophora attinorum]
MPSVTVHLIRHAQGFHNLGVEFHSLTDPRLTPLGQSQCLDLQKAHFPPTSQRRISLIAASPLNRTLHTAFITFQPLLDSTHPDHAEASQGSKLRKPEIFALPDAQETSDFPCDTGSAPNTLAEVVKEQKWPVDLSLLNEQWTNKALGTRYSPNANAIKARAKTARTWLREKAAELLQQYPDEDVQLVLVTHGGYLHYFTDDWEDATKGLGTGWDNCETRAYVFENGIVAPEGTDPDVDARLVETLDSRKRRGKQGPTLGWEDQRKWEEKTYEGWQKVGLQRPDEIGVEGKEWKSGLNVQKTEAALKHEQQTSDQDAAGPGVRQVESDNIASDMAGELQRERRSSVTVRAQA